MSIANIPVINFDAERNDEVIKELYEIKSNLPKELRCKDYILENGQIWTSWTVRESVYRKKYASFPTMARGLFTQVTNDDQQYIVARGYDKFFNILETGFTQWPALFKDTEGPYEITAKENGCIIFIAALTPAEVVVTSKHAIPAVKTDPTAHGGVGYNWLLRHLSLVGKTEKDLAEWLYDKRITLIAELCDDEFEQHILPYTGKDRGLYLHGINYNTHDLNTLPASTVQQVAIDFGFHTIDYHLFDNISQVKEFGENMQQIGLYKEREVEGVVVRFTNAMLESKDGDVRIIEPKKTLKLNYEKTQYYIEWLRKRVVSNPDWFKNYKAQKGIIFVRQEFEKFWNEGKISEE
ncbi:RNA ligase-domain-containing protein [Mycotypha africana]|uniref:RNA ligase-domain-containing protein n=1 Tax=Mycotypha africana TaxID=64632 RepID=UPI0023010AD7|nr:RNA ligase-domain-containing protein [Mycotypha africana]KAI8987648.1 RNA ligase-domain-containing protein [Mycotypha africana]